MAENGRIIIETVNLTKRYGEKTAVNRLNLQIREGEVFGLLGPNGAGKTTTILMLLGLTEPTEGTAAICGKNCTRDPIGVKRIAGYLPDNVGFYTDMTGRQNLRFTGRLNGLTDSEIEARLNPLLERVGLLEAADKKTGTYSRGMKQRLGVADVLMKDPKVIIMDEPTLGIDPEGMRELLMLWRDLAKADGRTLLISSHQLYQIEQVCDRVGIFSNGKLEACGDIPSLGKQLEMEKHHTLELSVSPRDKDLTAAISNIPGVSKITEEKDMLLIESQTDIREPLMEILSARKCTILHLRKKGADLDEIYRLYFEKAGQSNENDSRKKKPGRSFQLSRGKKA